MAYVPVPKDLTKVKTKVALNLTKRQLIFFSLAAVVGIPFYGFKGANVELPFYSGDICYLSACEEQKYFFADKNQNLEMWNDICLGEFEVINVPGNHVTCIHSEENATLLAQIIIERNIRG